MFILTVQIVLDFIFEFDDSEGVGNLSAACCCVKLAPVSPSLPTCQAPHAAPSNMNPARQTQELELTSRWVSLKAKALHFRKKTL